MNRWEYTVDQSLPSSGSEAGTMWEQRLVHLGRAGWELVTDHRLEVRHGQVQYVGTFKRLLTPERLAELAEEEESRSNAPTTARVRILDDLVARGALSQEEAGEYVSNGRIDDATWTMLKERFGLA